MSAKFNFKENLLKASNDENIDIAIKEWLFLAEERRTELDRVCICQHKLKNVTYLLNIKKGSIIIVGSTCLEKFEQLNLKKSEKNNNILNNILKNVMKSIEQIKGEYSKIDVLKQLEIYINNYIEFISERSTNDLNKTIEDLENINKIYNTDVKKYTEIINNEINKRRFEKERMETERLKIKEEYERMETERLKIKEEYERIETERLKIKDEKERKETERTEKEIAEDAVKKRKQSEIRKLKKQDAENKKRLLDIMAYSKKNK